MKAISPAQLARVKAAWDYVVDATAAGLSAPVVIDGLINQHRASVKLRPCGNQLHCAGVRGTCTWSASDGLLQAWRNNALQRLIMENFQ